MPWRSRLIASIRSSRSVDEAGVLRLDLAQFFLGAQVDGAEPLALAPQLVEPFLDRRRPRATRRPARSRPARATCAGSISSISRISCAMSAVRRSRPRAAPRRAPARCAPRPSPRARRARPCRPRRARSRPRRGGRRLRAARLRPARSRRSARGAFRRRLAGASSSDGALGLRLAVRAAPGSAIWLAAPLLASVPFGGARSRSRRGAWRATRPRGRAPAPRRAPRRARRAWRRPRRAIRRAGFPVRAAGAERLDRLRGVALGGERLVAARREPHLRLGERREPRGQRGSPRVRRRHAHRAPRRPARCASRRALRASASAATAAASSASAFRRCGACPRRRCARCPSSASRSARRFFSASRRAAAVGAFEAAAKPSQRHRSPSRETSRWPGLQLRNQLRPERAIDHADLREPARQLGRRRDMARERLDAVRQRRVGGIRRGAGPADRRGRIDRRIEIVAERGAERGLETLFDREQVDRRRPQLLGLDIDQLGERLALRPRAG